MSDTPYAIILILCVVFVFFGLWKIWRMLKQSAPKAAAKPNVTRKDLDFAVLRLYGAARVGGLENELSEILAEFGVVMEEKS